MRSRLAKKIIKNPERYGNDKVAQAKAMAERGKNRIERRNILQAEKIVKIMPEPALTDTKPKRIKIKIT